MTETVASLRSFYLGGLKPLETAAGITAPAPVGKDSYAKLRTEYAARLGVLAAKVSALSAVKPPPVVAPPPPTSAPPVVSPPPPVVTDPAAGNYPAAVVAKAATNATAVWDLQTTAGRKSSKTLKVPGTNPLPAGSGVGEQGGVPTLFISDNFEEEDWDLRGLGIVVGRKSGLAAQRLLLRNSMLKPPTGFGCYLFDAWGNIVYNRAGLYIEISDCDINGDAGIDGIKIHAPGTLLSGIDTLRGNRIYNIPVDVMNIDSGAVIEWNYMTAPGTKAFISQTEPWLNSHSEVTHVGGDIDKTPTLIRFNFYDGRNGGAASKANFERFGPGPGPSAMCFNQGRVADCHTIYEGNIILPDVIPMYNTIVQSDATNGRGPFRHIIEYRDNIVEAAIPPGGTARGVDKGWFEDGPGNVIFGQHGGGNIDFHTGLPIEPLNRNYGATAF